MIWIGVLQALLLTLLIALYNVYLRFAVQLFDIQPLVFTCITLMAGAFVLSFYAGPGRLIRKTLRAPATWVYSFVLIGAYVTDVYVVTLVTATEASLFSRLTIPLSLLMAYVFFKRKPSKTDLCGVGLVLIGLVLLLGIQPSAMLWSVILIASLSALLQVTHYFIAEAHPEAVTAQETGSLRDRARVVGFVTFVMSSLFLLGALVLSILDHVAGWGLALRIDVVPTLGQFAHPETIWAALIYGVLILPFARYCKWAASYNIKAENLIIFLAFIPFATLGLEWLAVLLTGQQLNALALQSTNGQVLLIVASLMTFAAALTAVSRLQKDWQAGGILQGLKEALQPKSVSSAIHHSATALDDIEIIENTLEFTGQDTKKAAKLLGIPHSTLLVLHQGQGQFALIADQSQHIARQYRHKVASRDSLTGLLNRSGFMVALKKALSRSDKGVLLYIDLDKFKPVNDTFGHDAGDAILTQTAERLHKVLPENAVITRMGGDEFCAYFPSVNKTQAKQITKDLKTTLAGPYKVKGIRKHIKVGASIGQAIYPDDAATPTDLINAADEGMYGVKHSVES